MPVVGSEMPLGPCHRAKGIYSGVYFSTGAGIRLPVSLSAITGLQIPNNFKAGIEKERLSEKARITLFSSP